MMVTTSLRGTIGCYGVDGATGAKDKLSKTLYLQLMYFTNFFKQN